MNMRFLFLCGMAQLSLLFMHSVNGMEESGRPPRRHSIGGEADCPQQVNLADQDVIITPIPPDLGLKRRASLQSMDLSGSKRKPGRMKEVKGICLDWDDAINCMCSAGRDDQNLLLVTKKGRIIYGICVQGVKETDSLPKGSCIEYIREDVGRVKGTVVALAYHYPWAMIQTQDNKSKNFVTLARRMHDEKQGPRWMRCDTKKTDSIEQVEVVDAAGRLAIKGDIYSPVGGKDECGRPVLKLVKEKSSWCTVS